MRESERVSQYIYIGVIGHMLLDVATLRTYRVCRHLGHDVGNVDFNERFKARLVGMLLCIMYSYGSHKTPKPVSWNIVDVLYDLIGLRRARVAKSDAAASPCKRSCKEPQAGRWTIKAGVASAKTKAMAKVQAARSDWELSTRNIFRA